MVKRHSQRGPRDWMIRCVWCEVAVALPNGVFCDDCRAQFKAEASQWAGV